jgi:hypothetical protein
VYRTDFILRLIEQLAQVLRVLRARILGREMTSEDARAEIYQVARQAGLDLDVARRLDPGMLLAWLAPTGEIDEHKIWLMAELLYLVALDARRRETGDHGSADLRRALSLFSRLPAGLRPSPDLAAAGERGAELRSLLGEDAAGDAPAGAAPGTTR